MGQKIEKNSYKLKVFIKPYIFNLQLLTSHRYTQNWRKWENIFSHIFLFDIYWRGKLKHLHFFSKG